MNVSQINYKISSDVGDVGSTFFANDYGAIVTKCSPTSYCVTLIKRLNANAWTTDMDATMLEISNTNFIDNLTEVAANFYIQQIENISL